MLGWRMRRYTILCVMRDIVAHALIRMDKEAPGLALLNSLLIKILEEREILET